MPNPAPAAITYTSANGIAVITLNREAAMNRMDNALMDGLHEAWKRFMAAPEDRVAVLTGAGSKAFCAGADLANPPRGLYHGVPGIGVAVDKPIIAAVAGWCVGGGMVLTTMCDLMIAADNAKFTYPEVKVGFSGGLITNLVTRIPHNPEQKRRHDSTARVPADRGPDPGRRRNRQIEVLGLRRGYYNLPQGRLDAE